MDYLYPHLYCLDEADEAWGKDEGDWVSMPNRLALSGRVLDHEHLFLMTGEFG